MNDNMKLALYYLSKLSIPLLPFDELDEKEVPVNLRTTISLEYVHNQQGWIAEVFVNFREKARTELHETPKKALDALLLELAEKVSNGE